MSLHAIFNQCRDKTRQTLHRITHALGENLSIKPESIYEQSQAKASLHLDLPSIKQLLPYETMDEQGLFINRNSAGIALELIPLAGADEVLMKSLAELFKNKLPAGYDCSILLYKHPYLNEHLLANYAPILKQGGVYAELARLSLEYHQDALKQGYSNGRNPRLRGDDTTKLCDYRCYLFLATAKQGNFERDLLRLKDDFISALKVAGFHLQTINRLGFIRLLRALISPNIQDTSWPAIDDNDQQFISSNIPHPSSVYEISDAAIDITVTNNNGEPVTSRIVNCEITNYPKDSFALWQTPDLFANLLKPEQGLHCPFLISFTIKGINQEKIKAHAKARAKSLNANNNAIQRFIHPGIADEALEWQAVHENTAKSELYLLPTFYNLVLFTSPEKEREHVAQAISSFRHCGFDLMQVRCKQWLRFLASFPFLLTEGLFTSLNILGLIRNLSHYNIANLLPVVADVKGSPHGLVLPTYRHQLFCFDGFNDQTLPITNYNRLTIASPGAGKTLFEQALILDGLSRGQLIFVIDLGASYKHLCQLVGGTYIDARSLSLNPFTLFDFDGITNIQGEQINDYIQIRDLLAIMASPSQALGEVEKAWLLDATLSAWQTHGRAACIDHVLAALQSFLAKPESRNDRRLKDLLILLSKYGRDGIYGQMFNNDTPLLNGSNFVVLEMGGLESNPELLTIVMFVMIVIIQGQFYHSDRRLKKRCVIDEAWRFLAAGSNPIAANFIEQGFRTARKHSGGFTVITQQLADTSKTVQGQAIAASSDTKIIMRQGAFKEYLIEHPNHFNPLQIACIEAFGEAKTQGFSNLMLQCGNHYSFHRYFCDPFSRVLFSTAGDEFGAIEELVAQGLSLTAAIKQVVQKYQRASL